LHAILPDDVRAGIDISKQIATLTSLRLLVRAGSLGGSDPLEPGGKFRVGLYVTWDYALALARSLDFELADFTTD
jgi:origin recognition complex subunit 5